MADLPTIRDAAAADLERARTTLAAAHRDHPWDRWACTGMPETADAGSGDPDDVEARLRRLTDAWFRLSVLPSGHARVADDARAVAVWIPSDAPPPDDDVVAALDAVADEVLGSRAAIVAEVEAAVRARRPEHPHVLLATLGTDPRHQGRGLATALLTDHGERLDEAGTIAALETSSARNVTFYERFGFEVTAEIDDLPHGAPTTWAMARRPR